mmetsp:Transcript_38400/g.85735  ORF Transcript_38400/g.85735 Transcript_38400/m.85735 type:complete len:210 (-) Transcript_38400:919-1548(-)
MSSAFRAQAQNRSSVTRQSWARLGPTTTWPGAGNPSPLLPESKHSAAPALRDAGTWNASTCSGLPFTKRDTSTTCRQGCPSFREPQEDAPWPGWVLVERVTATCVHLPALTTPAAQVRVDVPARANPPRPAAPPTAAAAAPASSRAKAISRAPSGQSRSAHTSTSCSASTSALLTGKLRHRRRRVWGSEKGSGLSSSSSSLAPPLASAA